MSDDQFFEFCAANPNFRIERTARGEIVIMPPSGFETGYRNSDLTAQLRNWSKVDGRGVALDSNTEYILPNGAARAPDASWVLLSRLDDLTKDQKRKFPPLCPDFVVELTSPTDRLKQVQLKMEEWIENGAKLGWLLDADNRIVFVYRPGRELQRLVAPAQIVGDDPVAGFTLDMADIWAGL